MMLKKVALKIHRWPGIASGLVVFVLGINGCLYAFEEEMKNLVYAKKRILNTPK